MPRSIRGVLLAGSVVLLAAVLGTAAWLGFDAGEDEARELFDARLATSARVLAALIEAQPPAPSGAGPVVVALPGPLQSAPHDAATPLGHHYETKIAFQVFGPGGSLAMRSAAAPPAPYGPFEPGFRTVAQGDHAWRVFALQAGERWILVGERDDVRGELAWKLSLATVAPLIVGIPFLLLLLGMLVRYGLRPLEDLARRIEAREPASLQPVELPRSATEIAPVVAALNGLLDRVRAALARERRFTAAAAHELRTPLAALKVHAQNAARATSPAQREASQERMLAGLERSIRLVEQMLAYSRAAAAPESREPRAVSLQQVVEDALELVASGLLERRVRFHLASEPPGDIEVAGDADKVVALVRNLLENAARYSPDGATVRIELSDSPGGASLAVIDEGPGIPEALRERVFESYYRIPGSPGSGSGLGLAIVREAATQLGAGVHITDGPQGRGARVVVRFPPRSRAPAPTRPAN